MINLKVNESDIKLEHKGDYKTLLSEITYAVNTLINEISEDKFDKYILLSMMTDCLTDIKNGEVGDEY